MHVRVMIRVAVISVACTGQLPALHAHASAQPHGCGSECAVRVDTAVRSVEVRAVYRPSQFNHGSGLHNHHLMVWRNGTAARSALLVCLAPDSAVHDALVSIGAVPGNNLTRESWERRNDRRSAAPDMRAEGSALQVTVAKASRAYAIADLLSDSLGRPMDWRFAGNRALISVWRSGCVLCLQSCPGSKVGNRSYTMRDLAGGLSAFRVRTAEGLGEGDTVTVRLHLSP